tara:strand:- start:163 stop:609 length:447 start_codon:yes stop_codon:yes gene_type:complete
MMLYDHDCPNCGIREDVPQRHQEHDSCPDCKAKVRVLLSPIPTHGIVFSNAEHSEQLGKTFHSNAEKRAYFKANPQIVPISKDSREDHDLKWRIENRREKTAKKHGYIDAEDHYKHMKAEKPRPRKHAPPPHQGARSLSVPPQRKEAS